MHAWSLIIFTQKYTITIIWNYFRIDWLILTSKGIQGSSSPLNLFRFSMIFHERVTQNFWILVNTQINTINIQFFGIFFISLPKREFVPLYSLSVVNEGGRVENDHKKKQRKSAAWKDIVIWIYVLLSKRPQLRAYLTFQCFL